jgi:SAM-dependent methyltransferase
MAERDTEIIARGYDLVADEYEGLESSETPWPRLERVRAFAADLPHGSRILDIGCGNGIPATQELALKHVVTRVDISEEQIARAKSNVPAATFICGDARNVDLPIGAFDACASVRECSLSGKRRPAIEPLARLHPDNPGIFDRPTALQLRREAPILQQ